MAERILLIDGAEGIEGRALYLISALYYCVESLIDIPLRFVDVEDSSVHAAIDLLRWDVGLDAAIVDPADESEMLGRARLYTAVRFRQPSWPYYDRVREAGVPTLVALQFPQQALLTAKLLEMIRPAHDTVCFAAKLEQALGRGQPV